MLMHDTTHYTILLAVRTRNEYKRQSDAMPTVATAIWTSSSSSSSAGYWSPMSDVSAGGGLSVGGRPRRRSQAIPASSPSAFFPASPYSQSSVREEMMPSMSGSSSLSSSCSSSVLLLSPRRRRSSVHRVNRCHSAIELSSIKSSRLVDTDYKSTIRGLLDEVDDECSALMAAVKRRRHDIDQEHVLGVSDDATIESNDNNRS